MTRIFDTVAALAALVVLSPALLLIAIAVKITSPGPILHRAQRTGRDGVPFELLKFRSMVVSSGGPAITRAGDSRVTPLGRILRGSKLDELPQLVNVLRGDMSLVGPRPEDPRYTALYDAAQRRILSYRPGITSAASLQYRDEESMIEGDDWEEQYVQRIMPEKLRIDLEYLERRSFSCDLRLIVRTVGAMFRKD